MIEYFHNIGKYDKLEGAEKFNEHGWSDRVFGLTVNSCLSDRDIIKYQRY